jgi:hypothetical protein
MLGALPEQLATAQTSECDLRENAGTKSENKLGP